MSTILLIESEQHTSTNTHTEKQEKLYPCQSNEEIYFAMVSRRIFNVKLKRT